jgi:hypothetical protein
LRSVGVFVSVHVDHLSGEERFPIPEGEEELLIVVAGIGGGIDVEESELAGVGAAVQIGHRHGVRVVPAGAGWCGCELVSAIAVRGDRRSVFFLDSVDFGGNEETVPVDEFGRVGVVDDVDGDWLALLHAEDGAGRGSVVTDGGEYAVGGEFDGDRGDADGDGRGIGAGCGGRRGAGVRAGKHDHLADCAAGGCGGQGEGSEFEEVSAVHRQAKCKWCGLRFELVGKLAARDAAAWCSPFPVYPPPRGGVCA